MKNNTHIAPNLILESENQKAVIFFFYLKSKYKTSVFYDYTPEKIAELSGVSVNTIRKYISWLKRNGYAAITNGNLWLRSVKKISDGERLIRVDSRSWTRWKNFENRVYSQIIKWNIMQQAFNCEIKRLSGNLKKSNDVRKIKSYVQKYGKFSKESDTLYPKNSTRQLAKLFNKSPIWVSRLLRKLKRIGYINYKENIVSLEGYVPPKYCEHGFAYFNKYRKLTMVHHGITINVKY